MATLDEIGEEKQRVCERLARLDTERARLADQLNELEIADRVLTVFGRRGLRTRRRRENLAATAPSGGEPSARGGRQMGTVAVRDAVLKAVEARPQGATASEVLEYVSQEFGLKVRPNHLGMALQRHRRAGRLQLRDPALVYATFSVTVYRGLRALPLSERRSRLTVILRKDPGFVSEYSLLRVEDESSSN